MQFKLQGTVQNGMVSNLSYPSYSDGAPRPAADIELEVRTVHRGQHWRAKAVDIKLYQLLRLQLQFKTKTMTILSTSTILPNEFLFLS